MADPVSWIVIEKGWTVLDSNGDAVGQVHEVTGDENADIFDGLAVAAGLLGKPRYVPAERVGEIVEGEVHLTIDTAAFDELGDYDGSPPSERV